MMKTTPVQKLSSFVLTVSIIGLVCLLTATFTTQMVIGRVRHREVNAMNYGDIQFGLIWGTKQFNYGYGTRGKETYNVYEEYDGREKFELILTTLCFVWVATLFTLFSIVFALGYLWNALMNAPIDIATSPKEDQDDDASMPQKDGKGPHKDGKGPLEESQGSPKDERIPLGDGNHQPEEDENPLKDEEPRPKDVPWLLIWNSISAGFCLLAIALYTSWYWVEIKDYDISNDEGEFVQVEGEKAPKIGYSFWLLVSGTVLLLTNVVITSLDWWRKTRSEGQIDPLPMDATDDSMPKDTVDLLPGEVPADTTSKEGSVGSQRKEPRKPVPDDETVDSQPKDAAVDLLPKDAPIGSLSSDRVDLLPDETTVASLPRDTVDLSPKDATSDFQPNDARVESLSKGAAVDLLPEVEITDL